MRPMDLSPSAAEAAPSRLDRLSSWIGPALVVVLLTFAAGLVVGNVLPARGELGATQLRLDRERAEDEKLRRRIASLDARARQLEKDPWLTEVILRDELKMSGENEILIR